MVLRSDRELALAARLAADPRAAWHALNCADARESFADFCGMVEIPGAPVEEDEGDDEEDDDGGVAEVRSALPLAPLPRIRRPDAAHHKALIALCERLERGETRRAMVFMPPGSAKSTYASVLFPAWCMGRRRRRNIIVATYASSLARKIGRRMRSVVRQKVYWDIFRKRLSHESSAADEWALTDGNEFMAGGILAGITGNRADGLVIDDPVKGRQDADSEQIQERTWGEYNDTLKTRLKPKAWTLLIQTRWNERDLAGQILPDDWNGESGLILCKDGLVWEVLCVPAEAEANDPLGREPGVMLWPEWFGQDPDFWTAAKRNARTWSALYQQRPQPAEGVYFKREYFKRYKPTELPAHLRIVGTSDYAVKADKGDYTVLRMWGIDPDLNVYLLPGGYRAQTDSGEWIERQIDLMERWSPSGWIGEAGVIQLAIEPALLRRMRERQVSCDLIWLPSIADKATRARGIQAWASMGCVYVPEGPEGDSIIDEYLRFPTGKNDDDVDNGSLLGRALDLKLPATLPPEKPKPEDMRGGFDITWDEAWRGVGDDDDGRVR